MDVFRFLPGVALTLSALVLQDDYRPACRGGVCVCHRCTTDTVGRAIQPD